MAEALRPAAGGRTQTVIDQDQRNSQGRSDQFNTRLSRSTLRATGQRVGCPQPSTGLDIMCPVRSNASESAPTFRMIFRSPDLPFGCVVGAVRDGIDERGTWAGLTGDLGLGRVVRYQPASTGWQRFCGRPAVITDDILHTVLRPSRVQSPARPYRGSASTTRAVCLPIPDKRDPPPWFRRTAGRSVARGAGRRVRRRWTYEESVCVGEGGCWPRRSVRR
jgi:hypothetical protein